MLDTLNNIKGYRYELWCIARAAGSRCCVLWVQCNVQVCRERHSRRSDQVRPLLRASGTAKRGFPSLQCPARGSMQFCFDVQRAHFEHLLPKCM